MAQTNPRRRQEQRRKRTTLLAKLLVALSLAAVTGGVAVLAGLGWALVAGGIFGVAYSLTLVDLDEMV